MKTTYRFILAVLAASVAIASCNKENISGSQNDGIRTISVDFAGTPLKSTLGSDGLTPSFATGDVIKVSNGTDAEDCAVTVTAGMASITTSLTGNLEAVYPSTAARMNGNSIEGIIVSTVQDGTFANANICRTTIAEGATSAMFQNQTAVFCITPGAGSGTKYVEVTTDGTEIANIASGAYTAMTKIHVATTSPAPVYVAILATSGLKIKDLTFADGVNIKNASSTSAVEINSLYTITGSGWLKEVEYVDLGLPSHLKWATCNLGASSPEEFGDYFAWGEIEGHTATYAEIKFVINNAFTFPGSNPDASRYTGVWTPANGFNDCNAPYFDNATDNYSTSKYNITTGKKILDPEDDAAHIILGGNWRIPTVADFKELIDNTNYTWTSNYNGTGIKGYVLKSTKNGESIFLPGAGNGFTLKINALNSSGRYISSGLSTEDSAMYTFLNFGSTTPPYIQTQFRYYGASIRPVSE